MSNLYVVGLDGPNMGRYLKVGMTSRSVYKRIGDWDTGSPFKHTVLFDMQVFDPHLLCKLERRVHYTLRDKRVRLEWFHSDPATVLSAIWDSCVDIGVDPVAGIKLHHAEEEWKEVWTNWQAKAVKAA